MFDYLVPIETASIAPITESSNQILAVKRVRVRVRRSPVPTGIQTCDVLSNWARNVLKTSSIS